MIYLDIEGKVNNMKLTKDKALLPLFEAIVNSLQSINELKNKEDTFINIIVNRDTSQQVDKEHEADGAFYPIKGFIVEDNGVGFNEANYHSFLNSDSTYKKSIGGKGLGRFLWLKAFEKASIDSIYENCGRSFHRRFLFKMDKEGIKDEAYEETENANRLTTIELINFKESYKNVCTKDLKSIALKIIEHCISFFINGDCPNVILKDNFNEISLNDLYNTNIKVNTIIDKFWIKENEFQITHIKLFSWHENKNLVHFSANGRDVCFKNLEKKIPNLKGKIKNGDQESFIYCAYISGKVFDENVNAERTGFNLSNNDEDNLLDSISIELIYDKAVIEIKKYLKPYLDTINEKKKQKIIQYISTKKPQYRTVLKYKSGELENIPPDLNEEDLELELFKLQQELNYETKKQGEEFLNQNKIKDIKDQQEYREKYNRYVQMENELGKATLAEYIVHRRIIIDLFENALNLNEENKYFLEEYIHNLIFPMQTFSDDIDYEKHNLWLIDEKLAYHYYLASDIKMKKNESINVQSDERPDIIIMDRPIGLVNETEKPYNTFTIIEFKRPMRDDYEDEENPIEQVINYTQEIREGLMKDHKGRQILVSDKSQFYLYIIADMTQKLKKSAINRGMTRTPDGMGYFWYNSAPEINAYVEIISYEKLLNDAKKRNRILFEKLFTPKM